MIIFYHPETLKIMGGSDGYISMEYPYIEVEESYHSFENLYIEKGTLKLKSNILE